MKRTLLRIKKSSHPTGKARSLGAAAAPESPAGPQDLIPKEEYQLICEIQNVLSPYWSARFDR
jgi:hypothetical protein